MQRAVKTLNAINKVTGMYNLRRPRTNAALMACATAMCSIYPMVLLLGVPKLSAKAKSADMVKIEKSILRFLTMLSPYGCAMGRALQNVTAPSHVEASIFPTTGIHAETAGKYLMTCGGWTSRTRTPPSLTTHGKQLLTGTVKKVVTVTTRIVLAFLIHY